MRFDLFQLTGPTSLRAMLAAAAAMSIAAWWHADDFAQARYDHQVAARQCYHRYDATPPGPDFISVAEANVDACYDARLVDYHRSIADVSWVTALGVGVFAAASGLGLASLAGVWRPRKRTSV